MRVASPFRLAKLWPSRELETSHPTRNQCVGAWHHNFASFPPAHPPPSAPPAPCASAVVKNTRVTYTKRNPYRTKSNTLKMVKTPGGRMAGHYRAKLAKAVRCGDCGGPLPGVREAACRRPPLASSRALCELPAAPSCLARSCA